MINKIWQYIKSRKYVLIFSCVYFLIRLAFLNSYFFLRDERDLFLTALSLAQTGKDLYGHVLPLIFLRISPQAPLLGMYWTVPMLSFFHIMTPLFVKILYILPTLFFPLFVYELLLEVTKEKKISFIASFVISFSPWFYHISRLGIEAHLAYFFCLFGLILYIRKQKIIALLFLVLSYFSYFGIRPFIFIVVPYIELWEYFLSAKKPWNKLVASLFIFAFLFSCVYLASSQLENTAARSTSEVIFLNKEKLSSDTNFLRSISDVPFFVRGIFDNKVSIIFQSLFNNFFKGIDFSYLFFTGDYVGIYANQITGQFFPFLFIFLIFGICYLAKKKRDDYYFIAGFSIVGLISSLINSYSLTFSIRSIFSLLGIGFICALGIVYFYELCDKKVGKLFIGLSIFVYVFFSIHFAYKYLFQHYKVINAAFNEQEKYLAIYCKEHAIKNIFVPNIHSYYLSYLSTFPSLSPKIFQQVQIELNKQNGYLLDGRRFNQCRDEQFNPASINDLPGSSIIETSCLSAKSKLYIRTYTPKNIIPIPDTQYDYGNINRNIKYYFVK